MATIGNAKDSANALDSLRTLDRKFFTTYALAGIVAVFIGFANTYYLRSYAGLPPLAGLIHLHAFVFSAWMVLFVVQTCLVAAKRVALHTTLGLASIGLAVAMFAVGLVAGVIGARDGWTGPHAPRDPVGGLAFLTVSLGDMLLFGAFFAGAVVYRRKPEIHKRLILLAMCGAIMPAAFFRLSLPVANLLTLVFLLAGPIYDLLSRRRIHSVYKWGVPLVIVSIPLRQILGATEMWHSFARWLLHATGAA